MKKQASLITYVAALVIGIILLVLNEKVDLLKGVVIAMGVAVTVPSALLLISTFVGKKDANGVRTYPAWYTVIVSLAGLVLGIWMLCMPTFFVTITVYTLGVGLVLVGIAQILFIANAARPFGPNVWWYCVPVLAVTGGLIICFIGPKPVNDWAVLTTGIILVVYAVNGVAALGREGKANHEIEAEKEFTEEAEKERNEVE